MACLKAWINLRHFPHIALFLKMVLGYYPKNARTPGLNGQVGKQMGNISPSLIVNTLLLFASGVAPRLREIKTIFSGN